LASRQLKNIEEQELVSLLRQKDKAALEYLYDHYSAALHGIILRIVRSEDIAQEVLQDAFLKIWKNMDAYDPAKGRLFTWMLNISRNLAIDKTRSKEIKREQKTDRTENIVNRVDLQYYVEYNPENIGVKELLDKLNPDQRKVVDLLYFQGYTQSEVAKEYEIPLGTIKTRLRIALKELRKIVYHIGH
jgi:RNA polymerase sigma factor (sigma-70 family)